MRRGSHPCVQSIKNSPQSKHCSLSGGKPRSLAASLTIPGQAQKVQNRLSANVNGTPASSSPEQALPGGDVESQRSVGSRTQALDLVPSGLNAPIQLKPRQRR